MFFFFVEGWVGAFLLIIFVLWTQRGANSPGRALPYLANAGMCRWTGYGFQGPESSTGYTISLLSVSNRVSLWTGSLSKSVNTCDERPTFSIPITFFLNIYFHDFSVKNYLILHAKQRKSGSESSISCLRQGSEMRSFCLKQGRGLRASAAHLYPNFPWVRLPPPPFRANAKEGLI